MKETFLFEDWLHKLIAKSVHSFVRDSESLLENFYEIYNELPFEYKWKVYSVKDFNKAMRSHSTSDGMNRLYWHDMASNIEAYGVMTIWRAGEIINSVIKSLNSGDILVPATLSRSLLEIAALSLKESNIILKTIEEVNESLSIETNANKVVVCEDLERILVRIIWGTRLKELADHPQQINALTYIQWLSKNPNAKELLGTYEFLCELAHPNIYGNARFWPTVKEKNLDGSETVRMKRHAESIMTTDVLEKTIWALGWSAGIIRNSFELLHQANLIIINRWSFERRKL